MNQVFVTLGQAMMFGGLLIAVTAQIFAFFRITQTDSVKAVLALVLPGYLLYYVWRSDNKMPRVFRAWMMGVALFVVGVVTLGIAMDY